jgi:hypothetical protein
MRASALPGKEQQQKSSKMASGRDESDDNAGKKGVGKKLLM